MCMYVCACVYLCLYAYVCAWECICASMCVHSHVHICVLTHVQGKRSHIKCAFPFGNPLTKLPGLLGSVKEGLFISHSPMGVTNLLPLHEGRWPCPEESDSGSDSKCLNISIKESGSAATWLKTEDPFASINWQADRSNALFLPGRSQNSLFPTETLTRNSPLRVIPDGGAGLPFFSISAILTVRQARPLEGCAQYH